MEELSFALTLVDKVAGPAKKAAESLRGVERQAKDVGKALNFEKDLERVNGQLAKIKADPKGFKELMEAQKKLGDERRKLGKEPFFKSLGEEIGKKFSFSKLLGAEVLADTLVEGAKHAVEVITEGVKKAFEEATRSENLQLGARLSLGKEGGKEFGEDIERFSKQTGMVGDQIAAMLLPLRRAGFDQKGARTAFALAGDIAAGQGRGGDQGAIGGTLETLENIMLKGGVDKRRLATLGVSAKDFSEILGKKQGVSPEQVLKLAEAGKLDPRRIINTIAEVVQKQQGGKLGTGTEAYSKTLGARFSKLTSLPGEFLKKIVESPAWNKISDRLGTIFEKLSPESPIGKKVIGGLLAAFNAIGDAIDKWLTNDNLDKFFDNFGKWLDRTKTAINLLVSAVEILAVVWLGSKLVGAVTLAANVLPTLASAAGSTVAVLGAITAPMLAVAAAVAAVGAAVYEVVTHWKELKAAFGDEKTWDRLKGFASNPFANPNPELETAHQGLPEGVRPPSSDGGAPAPRVAQAGGKNVTVAPSTTVIMQAAPGESPESQGRRAASAAHGQTQDLLEREKQHLGAG